MLWRLIFFALIELASGFNIFCYYTNWAQYRPSPWKFFPVNVDPSLCTHISYAFSKPIGLSVATFEWNDEAMYSRIMKLKVSNYKLKILLAIGGASMASWPFLTLAQNNYNREQFANNVVRFLRQRDFDGFELDWEYPDASQKVNFAELVKTLRKHSTLSTETACGRHYGSQSVVNIIAFYKHFFCNLANPIRTSRVVWFKKLRNVFEEEAKVSNKPRLELGVATAAGKSTIDSGLNISAVAQYADYLNVMTYDFHGSWNNFVGFNSPLYAYTGEQGAARFLNLDWVAKYYVSEGAPKDKLHLGIASYGRSFTLNNKSSHDVLSLSNNPGHPGPFTRLGGILSYYEVCQVIKSGGRIVHVESQGNPYVLKDDQWIGYDDVESVVKKACYVKSNNYGGAIFWTLDFDDFTDNACSQGRYPLLHAVNNALTSGTGCNDDPRAEATSKPIVPPNQPNNADGFKVVCYYTNWAQYRPAPWTYFPENVNPNLCTHISYAFAKPIGLTIVTFEWNDDTMYTRIILLKQQNPYVKILLAIGGASMSSWPFLSLSSSNTNREQFAQNTVRFLRERNFDGLELDWEYPDASQKEQFTQLVQKLREVFETEAIVSGKARLELGVATAAGKSTIDSGLNIAEVSISADYLNVMTYDFHGSWNQFVGFNSPLYAYSGEQGDARYLNLDWVAKYYVSQGADKKKLHLGVASYGRSFTLNNPSQHAVLSPASLPGYEAPFTRQAGVMSYYEVCAVIKSGGKIVQVESQGNPYVVKDNQWIGFDDIASVTKKACYVRENSYGGVIFWTLDYDDFLDSACGQGSYPLLNAVNKALFTVTGCSLSRLQSSDADIHVVGRYLWLEILPVMWSIVSRNVI